MSGRLLVTYDNASSHVSMFCEYLNSVACYSSWDVRYLHVTHDAKIDCDFNEFDAILHNYCARLDVDGYIGEKYLELLKQFRGIKLLSVQDEWDRPDKIRNAVRDLGFHVVLSCVTERSIARVYPPQMFPGTEFIPVLAGFVPEHLAERGKTATPLKERPIVVGYRGRVLGARYGRLGFMKVEIGRRMREICEARGIPHDIEWTEDKRIYGGGWYDFIASCRANLGTEGGSNVFDFDGAIEAAYRRLSAERGGPVPYQEFRQYTDPIEAQYEAGQLTPRLFEAVALRTPLILFPGRYSGLIAPEEHYIELKEDFSNVDAVLARLEDLPALEAMADRAYRRLVGSGEFGYRRFVEWLDALLARKAGKLGLALRPARAEGDAEIGADLAALASLSERPTRAPRHVVFYNYKETARENALFKEEIARLNTVYPAEVDRLNKAYSADIARLNEIIGELNRRRWGILAFAEPYVAKAAKAALVLKILLGDRLGRAALGEAASARRNSSALLVQLARVIAARGGAGATIVPVRSGAGFDLRADAETQPAGMEAASDDFVAALTARRAAELNLVIDREKGECSRLLQYGRYELPDLLEWLQASPDRAARLGLRAGRSGDAAAPPAGTPATATALRIL